MEELVSLVELFGLKILSRLGVGKGEVLAYVVKDLGEVEV